MGCRIQSRISVGFKGKLEDLAQKTCFASLELSSGNLPIHKRTPIIVEFSIKGALPSLREPTPRFGWRNGQSGLSRPYRQTCLRFSRDFKNRTTKANFTPIFSKFWRGFQTREATHHLYLALCPVQWRVKVDHSRLFFWSILSQFVAIFRIQ